MNIRWMELKSLDKSTNHTSRTEMIKRIMSKGHNVRYYCVFKKEKNLFSMEKGIINYISAPSIPRIRFLFLYAGMLWQIVKTLYFARPHALIIDYSINLLAFPFLVFKKVLNRKTNVILDVRTIPVNIKSFHLSKKVFFFSLSLAKLTCDGMSFITPYMLEYCSNQVHLKKKKVTTWTSGFSESIFNPTEYQKTRSDSMFEIFYHGGISLSRGIGSLIEAVKILRDKDYPVTLTLIGNVVDKQEILDLIRTNELENTCKLFPPVTYEEIPQWIKNCDLPVIPLPDFIGWRVSSPIKLMEYLAMAKPIALTDIEAHRNVVDNQEFSFYAESSSPKDLALAIERAFKRKSEFAELGKSARELALSQYTWEHQANKLISFLDTVSR